MLIRSDCTGPDSLVFPSAAYLIAYRVLWPQPGALQIHGSIQSTEKHEELERRVRRDASNTASSNSKRSFLLKKKVRVLAHVSYIHANVHSYLNCDSFKFD